MRKILSVLLVAMLLVSTCVVSCAAAEEEKKILVGLSQNRMDEYSVSSEAYYKQLIEEKYPNVELVITNALNEAERQLSDVESLILQGCDVIIFRAIDAESGVACIEKIKEAGIYCVLLDSAVNTDLYDVRVMCDQIDNGRAVGTYLQQWLDADENRTLNMGYIHGGTNENVMKRELGIYETCTSDRLKTVVTDCAFWSTDKAMSLAEDWLMTYPDLNCICCASDEMAIAVIQALQGANVDLDNFIVTGVDGTAAGQEAIRAGGLDVTSYQDNAVMISKVMEVVVGLVNGETFEKEINPHALAAMSLENIDELVGPAQK